MPCEMPGIIPINSECCFVCYDPGRLPYAVPLAIVLHEYDGTIEEMNNEHERCCSRDKKCHASFHYGVGQNGSIYNWVDPDDTAWSFFGNSNCGICGWSVGQSQQPQDPNSYTINIAIATGVRSIVSTRRGPQNVYSDDQYDALVRLVGWLAETYDITVDQNNIWRHCDELYDFPSACPNNKTYSDFLEDIQACIDTEQICLPGICSQFCECKIEDGPPSFVLGADENCENCGRYKLDLCEMIADLPAGVFKNLYLVGVDEEDECIYMPVDMKCDPTQVISSALGLNENGVPGFYPVKEQLTHRDAATIDSLIPADDRIVRVNAENDNVVFTLSPPDDCDPQDFWIKRLDCNGTNSCIIDGNGALIDGVPQINLDAPTKWGQQGESVHLYWDGNNWSII